MSDESLFSPLDLRYRSMLPDSLSEMSLLKAQIKVERTWLKLLVNEGLCPNIKDAEIDRAFEGLGFAEIEKIEERTKHATRALVEALANRLKEQKRSDVAAWVHVGLTSFDTVDTASRLRLKTFINKDYLPSVDALKAELVRLAKKFSDLEGVGRTHGQWAVPTLFGLQFAEAYERIKGIEKRVQGDTKNLCGQASGAIGGYHASGLLVADPLGLEKKFLSQLGLSQHLASTQIIPPEDILFLAQSLFALSSVVAKLATDLRHLARSEISEVSEGMAPGQVGSSTMPQKRNPWNLEHVCSLYKVLASKLVLLENDLVSEHQRDLTNSASSRFYVEYFAVAFLMVSRLTKVLSRIEVDSKQVTKHLELAGTSVMAEAFYVLATKEGELEAHHEVREAARESEKSGKTLFEVCSKKKLIPQKMNLKKLQQELLKGSHQKLQIILKGN